MMETPENILEFWFEELTQSDWFRRSDELDEMIRHRFKAVHDMARKGELYSWRVTPIGRLAEIIVLDQFSRNIYRDTPDAFACDSQALILAQEMIILEEDEKLSPQYRTFAYMPFMHSESRLMHVRAVDLFTKIRNHETLKFEMLHKKIIDEFGRFPHRNKILGRMTTLQEAEYLLTNPGF